MSDSDDNAPTDLVNFDQFFLKNHMGIGRGPLVNFRNAVAIGEHHIPPLNATPYVGHSRPVHFLFVEEIRRVVGFLRNELDGDTAKAFFNGDIATLTLTGNDARFRQMVDHFLESLHRYSIDDIAPGTAVGHNDYIYRRVGFPINYFYGEMMEELNNNPNNYTVRVKDNKALKLNVTFDTSSQRTRELLKQLFGWIQHSFPLTNV